MQYYEGCNSCRSARYEPLQHERSIDERVDVIRVLLEVLPHAPRGEDDGERAASRAIPLALEGGERACERECGDSTELAFEVRGEGEISRMHA